MPIGALPRPRFRIGVAALLLTAIGGCSRAKEPGFIAPMAAPAAEMSVPVFSTREQYEHALQAATDDAPDRSEALLAGFLVQPYTTVLIVGEGTISYKEKRVDYFEFELLEGDHKGQRAFYARTAIRKGAPPSPVATTSPCDGYVKRLASGQFDVSDESWLGAEAPLAKRIATRSLVAADLALESGNLPCPGEGTVAAFATAAIHSPVAWSAVEDVSASLRQVLANEALPPEVKAILQERIDTVARQATAAPKTAEDLAKATNLCGLTDKFNLKPSAGCRSAMAKEKILKAREEASAKAKEAADTAKEVRCDAIRDRQGACNLACMDRFEPGDPRADACGQRCDAAARMGACD